MDYIVTRRYTDNELMHYGVLGMKWGKRKSKYDYQYAKGQKPKNAYQKVARSIGGTKFAKNAILNNNKLSSDQKRKALKEHASLADEKAYNKARKKSLKTGGQMVYDVTTGRYSVDKNAKKERRDKLKAEKKAIVADGKRLNKLRNTADYYDSKTGKVFRSDREVDKMLNDITTKKGKEYAAKVAKQANKEDSKNVLKLTVGIAAGSAAYAAGLAFVIDRMGD